MGKIRVKTLGIEELEKEEAKEAKKRQEAKKTAKAPGLKGGERVVAMAPTEEELAKELEKEKAIEPEKVSPHNARASRGKKISKARQRSKRYRDALIAVDRSKSYTLTEAIELIKKLGNTKFDSTVELHINTTEKGISGQVTLPHGSGKTLRVAIADGPSQNFEELLTKIESGKIDFDILIAHPGAMPRLAKVAKILGPRGLMPNPKSGTISDKPEELAKKFAAGVTNFRTETQAPIIHGAIGKLSFSEKDLEKNIEAFVKAVGVNKIRSVIMKSTMSPGIKLDTSTI